MRSARTFARKRALGGAAPARFALAVLAFAELLLRGVGQVMLQNHRWAGLFFLMGIFYNSALCGVAVLVGVTVSTATALLLGFDRSLVRAGLFGFNGALVAVALVSLLQPDPWIWAGVVWAAACSTILMAAANHLLAAWKVPALTAPFVFTTLCFLAAGQRFGLLQAIQAPPTAGGPTDAAMVERIVSASTVLEGLFSGLAQVFFQNNAVTGALFAIGLLISSRAAGATALLGSLIGLLLAWGLGAAEPAMRAGIFGFNPVLTAIALGSVFFVRTTASMACALLGTVATVGVFEAVSVVLAPLGWPVLTLPFVLVVGLFMLVSPLVPGLRRATGV